MTRCASILLVLATIGRLVSTSDDYNWFNIVSNMSGSNAILMALDIDEDRVNCPKTNVIICPWDQKKLSQRWRWDGHMLKSNLNGLVMRVNELKRVVLAYPTNSEDQQFYTKHDGRYIYTDKTKSVHSVVQPAKGATSSGTRVKVCTGLGRPYQYFVFKRV